MKKILTVLLISILGFGACKQKQENVLAGIKEKQEKINNTLNKYTVRQVDDLISKERGVITGYFRDEEAKKVSTQHFGTGKRSYIDYYFDDGMLILVESHDFVYNRPNTYTEEVAVAKGDSVWYDDKKTVLETNYYYFSDNKLIKWTGPSEKDVPVNIANFSQKEPEIIAHALLALKQLKIE